MIRSIARSFSPAQSLSLWLGSLLISFAPIALPSFGFATDTKPAFGSGFVRNSPNNLNGGQPSDLAGESEFETDGSQQRRQGLIGRIRNRIQQRRREKQQQAAANQAKKDLAATQKEASKNKKTQKVTSQKTASQNNSSQRNTGTAPWPSNGRQVFTNGETAKRPQQLPRQKKGKGSNMGASIAFPTPAHQGSRVQQTGLQQPGQFQPRIQQPALENLPQAFQKQVSNQIVKQEAVIGDQFNIGHIVFRLSPADYQRWLTRSIFVSDNQGRLMYPAVVPSFIDKLESRFNENLTKEPRDVHIWFVFGGRQPITVNIHAAGIHQVVLAPESVGRLRVRWFTQGWWRNFNQMLQAQSKSSDYPPMVQAYLGCLVQQRVGLPTPALAQDQKSNPSPMMQTWELLTASENLQVNYLKEMMCGQGQDALPANLPLPNNIQWQQPIIPAVNPNVKVEPIAFVVPEECFYLRFGNWENQIWLKHLMQEHGGNLSRMVRLRGYQSLVGDLFRDQLAMESSSLDDLFGGQVIEDVAVVGFDTFFSNGAAAGLILQSKGDTLQASLNAKRKAFAKKHKDLGVKLSSLKIDQTDATLLQSPDGRIRSYYVHIADFHCITTSYALAERFLMCTKGVGSLGMSREFQYARMQMPLDRQDTIFAYLSTKFLQNILSPNYQIELRRRLRSITEVQTLQLATWSAQAERQAPPAGYADWESVPMDFRIAQLITRGYLPRSFNQRPDGSKIGLLEDTSKQWELAKAKRGSRKKRNSKGTRRSTEGRKKKSKGNQPPLLNSFFGSLGSKKEKDAAKGGRSKSGASKSESGKPQKETKQTPGSLIPLIGPGSKTENKNGKGSKQNSGSGSSGSVLESQTLQTEYDRPLGNTYYVRASTQAAGGSRQQIGEQIQGRLQELGNFQQRQGTQQGRGDRPIRRGLRNLIRNAINEIGKENGAPKGNGQPGQLPLGPIPTQPLPQGQIQVGPPNQIPFPIPGQGNAGGQPTPAAKKIDEANPVGRYLYGDTLRGVRGWMLPIADTILSGVTQEEAAWYAGQAQYFQQQWKRADPIMIGIKRYELEGNVERVVFDGRIAPFGGESLSWITSNIGKPMEVVPKKNPDDVIRFQASIQGGTIFPGTGPHQLVAAVQRDARQLHSVDPSEWWTTFKLIKDTPGYIASWPTAGILDYLPMLGGQPDAEGFTHSIGRKVWRLQHNGFSVIAMDKNRLRKMRPFLDVQPAKNPAQVRLEVSDLGNSQLADWANALWKQRSWQSSVANVRLMHLLMQYFQIPAAEAKQKAQSLLNAKLVCSLGGNYQLAGPPPTVRDNLPVPAFQDGMIWQSSHWPASSRVASNQLPQGQSPLLMWFRGALLEVNHHDSRFLVHGYLDVQRNESAPAKLPSFKMFQGFKF